MSILHGKMKVRIALVFFTIILYINGINLFLSEIGFDTSTDLLAKAIFSAIVLGGLGIFILKASSKKFTAEELGLRTGCKSIHQFLLGAMIAIIMIVVLVLFGILIGFEFRGVGYNLYSSRELFKTIICGIIISSFAGFIEEIAFRGYLFNLIHRKYSISTTVMITSLLFAFVHLPSSSYTEVLSFLVPFSTGIMFALLRLNYKSIWIGIGLHFAYDFLLISMIGIGSDNKYKASLFVFDYIPKKITIFNSVIGDATTLIVVFISITICSLLLIRLKQIKHII